LSEDNLLHPRERDFSSLHSGAFSFDVIREVGVGRVIVTRPSTGVILGRKANSELWQEHYDGENLSYAQQALVRGKGHACP
jgi:hypothetical protein